MGRTPFWTRTNLACVACAWLLVLITAPAASAQATTVDAALAFYGMSGAYCFRVAPLGTALAEESEWTVMVLTSASNHRNTFRIRSVDPGDSGLKGSGLQRVGGIVNEVWKFDGTREEFFERFAKGIRDRELRARVVKVVPTGLATMSSIRERAELYLKFADKGTKVSFDEVPDLTAEQFLTYLDFVPD
ncbi:MAG: hypothetical protein JSU08_14650 [Acidobacteria bacterium]|nr:hypothetical protein [Acidobacteriota bacterium]